jgi:ribosome-binding factor A
VSKRVQRVNELIREQISRIILREIEFSPGILATVTRVETSSDLRDANVFISVLPEEKRSKTVDFLNRRIGFLQREINKLLRMKPLPRLNFLEEKETVQAGRIEEILVRLKNQEK